MTTRRPVKALQPKLVAVIASDADLNAAVALKKLPDLFEVRLDSLFPIVKRIEKRISLLRAPLIITARDPREGGIGNLSVENRSALLQRFLARATFIDVELRSARQFRSLLADASKRKVGRILSYHNFKSTPSSRSLYAKARMAKRSRADIFKIATRTDTPAALGRLVDLITSHAVKLPLSAMGIGRLGALSRLLLARCGSVLNYAALGRPNVEGQLSIALLQSAMKSTNELPYGARFER